MTKNKNGGVLKAVKAAELLNAKKTAYAEGWTAALVELRDFLKDREDFQDSYAVLVISALLGEEDS